MYTQHETKAVIGVIVHKFMRGAHEQKLSTSAAPI